MTRHEESIKNIVLRAEVLGRKNWLHAINILERAVDEYPRERSIYLTMGDIYMRHKKHEQAIDSYQKALTIDPRDEHLLFIIGNCYLSLSDYKMALYYYDQVTNDAPELNYNKALSYAYNGEHDLSVHYLKTLLRQVSDNPNIYYFMVEELLRLHKYSESLDYLDRLEKQYGIQRYAEILRGFVWNFRKIWLKSYTAFQKADSMETINNPDHLHSFAQAAWQIGQLDKAVELLNKAIGINPHINLLHEDLVRVYLQQKDYVSAGFALQRAMKLSARTDPVLLILKDKLDKLMAEQHKITPPEDHDPL